jgi:hypothetical protein
VRANAVADIQRTLQGGTLCWAGTAVDLEATAGRSGARGAQAGGVRPKIEEALQDRIRSVYHRFDDGDRVFKPGNVERLFTVAARDRAGLDSSLALFSTDGHLHGNHALVEALSGHLKASTKNSGRDVADHFRAAPFGWQQDLVRYVAAAMFVDGKLSAVDRAGRRHDDWRTPEARALFGTFTAFRETRLDVEEEALTPQESSDARALLTELGATPSDGNEVSLKEATLQLHASLKQRTAVVDRARAAGLPLPPAYGAIQPALDSVDTTASRVKVVRALLAQAQPLREAAAALKRLEDFDRGHGLAQYQRSQQLLALALDAGLDADATHGAALQDAQAQIESIKQQQRVMEDWDDSFAKYREVVIGAVRAVYTPLRTELSRRTREASRAIKEMPEFKALTLLDQGKVTVEFLGRGKPLAEVTLPKLIGEQDLLDANAEYSIGHMTSALAALDSQVSAATARALQLYQEQEEKKGLAAKTAGWSPSKAFAGKRFTTEDEVRKAFDDQRDALIALVKDGKTVHVI